MSYDFKLQIKYHKPVKGEAMTDYISNFTESDVDVAADALIDRCREAAKDLLNGGDDLNYGNMQLFKIFNEVFEPGSKQWEYFIINAVGDMLASVIQQEMFSQGGGSPDIFSLLQGLGDDE